MTQGDSVKPFLFEAHSSKSFMDPVKVVDSLGIAEGEEIADFGCGSGHLTIPMARTVGQQGQVFALDILDGALANVNSRARLENLRNIKTIKGNLEELEGTTLDNNSVDTVLMSNILFQASKPEGVLKEAWRILKLEGRLIIIEWHPEKAPIKLGKHALNKPEMLKFVEENHYTLRRDFEAGETHYGLEFGKSE